MLEALTFLGRRCKNPTAASPFGFVCGKSTLQAEITLLSRSCTPRGAGIIEFDATIKPCCGWEQEKISEDQEQWRGQGFPQPPAGALLFAPGSIHFKPRVTFLCTLGLLFSATFKLQTSHYHFLPDWLWQAHLPWGG